MKKYKIYNSKGEIRTLDLTDCAEQKRLNIVFERGRFLPQGNNKTENHKNQQKTSY